jgi:hypothetical protein
LRQRHAKPLVYACLLAVGLCGAAAAQDHAEPVPCVGCQVLSLIPAQVDALPGALGGVAVALRIAPGDPSAWPRALDDLHRRGASAGLHVTGVPASDDPLLSADVDRLIVEVSAGDPDRLAFDLKRALSAARGQRPSTRLFVAAPAALVDALRSRGLTPYADAYLAPAQALPVADGLFTPLAGDETVVRVLPEDVGAAASIVAVAVKTRDWFPPGLVSAAGRPMHCAADRAIPAWLNAQTLDLVAISAACPAPAVVTADLAGAVAERVDAGGISAFRVRAGAGDRFAEGVTVGAARSLTAEEIVARHQAAAARQAAAIQTDVATGSLTLTFEAPGFVAPVTVTSATTIFREGTGIEMRQAGIRVNGVTFAPKNGVPRLPILEPERVAAVPLTITLSSVYRYGLDGRETIDGRPCYVIAFSPQAAGASLFSGRAWIDERTFAMVRVSASQTGLKGAIVASEQTDTFAPDAAGRWLLARSDIRQTYEGASVRTPIHRLLEIDRHEINAADFAARRAAAYASSDVMLRDTPNGFRYLEREAGSGTPGATPADASGIHRVVAPPVTRIRTFAAGVIVDPNISVPLPFAGLSYVDFDLLHTGAQFSGFFGGSYAQLAFSAPSVARTRWQIAGRAFAIATSYNDRAFDDGREIYPRDIRQRPAQAALWALRPIGARAAIRVEYDWDYNRFGRGDATDPAFVIPADQNAHGLRLGLDVQHAGWQTSIWASRTIRLGWHRWGIPGSPEDEPSTPSFDRAGATVQRTAALSPRVSTRVEAAFVTGRDMDRFSRIAFGAFDNRLHGYPSALIRYDRGGVLRTAVSWAAAKVVRLDGFADTAAVHDPAFGRGLRNYTGFGAALECPAPFGTLAAVEWGYGVQGVNTDGRKGTQVVRITGYKVF